MLSCSVRTLNFRGYVICPPPSVLRALLACTQKAFIGTRRGWVLDAAEY